MHNDTGLSSFTERKNFLSLSELTSFYNIPESNPLMIVDSTCKIIFSNSTFRNNFAMPVTQTFFDLNSEPDLGYLLIALTGSSYNNFHFDLYFSTEHELKNYNYNVEAERILIEGKEYFVLIFKSLEEKAELEEKINNLHNALEYGHVPILTTDSEGKVTYATNSFEKILKKGIESIYNVNLSDALSFYLTQEEKRQLDEGIENCRIWMKTISFTDADESIHYLELKLNPVFRTGEDSLKFILTANDITNYILKNQFIKRSERRLKSIIDNISDLLFIIKGKSGELLFENANENFCRIFSIDKNKSYKKNIETILEKKFFEFLKISISRLGRNGEVVSEEGRSDDIGEFNYSGSRREYRVKITAVDDKIEGEKIFIVSMHDVTDQVLYEDRLKKAYEKEMSLHKLKTALLENMSHEIRTPLNAITGYSEIIEDCIADKDYNTILDLVFSFKDVLNRVLKLFSNIVYVSQIESGEVELELVEMNCNQVLKSVFHKKQEDASSKKIKFCFESDPDEIIIRTDWVKFEKIISSLVDNAIKYTDYGEVKISSKVKGSNAIIQVSDTGKGIDMTEIKSMLEPFVQDEEAYVRKYEGAGLGLTVAYKLTKFLGGEFDIMSERDKGTTIQLSFSHPNQSYA